MMMMTTTRMMKYVTRRKWGIFSPSFLCNISGAINLLHIWYVSTQDCASQDCAINKGMNERAEWHHFISCYHILSSIWRALFVTAKESHSDKISQNNENKFCMYILCIQSFNTSSVQLNLTNSILFYVCSNKITITSRKLS